MKDLWNTFVFCFGQNAEAVVHRRDPRMYRMVHVKNFRKHLQSVLLQHCRINKDSVCAVPNCCRPSGTVTWTQCDHCDRWVHNHVCVWISMQPQNLNAHCAIRVQLSWPLVFVFHIFWYYISVLHISPLPGCFRPWTFFQIIGFNMVLLGPCVTSRY